MELNERGNEIYRDSEADAKLGLILGLPSQCNPIVGLACGRFALARAVKPLDISVFRCQNRREPVLF
jgi:hypothetical protein